VKRRGGGGGTEKYISIAAAWGQKVAGLFATGASGSVWCLTCPAYDMQHASQQLLHIDFGDCFEASMNRDIFPEKVGGGAWGGGAGGGAGEGGGQRST
jgi:hypothetical protein